MSKKLNSSNKKFKCSYCEQTSNKKSNIKIHVQRKHKKRMAYNRCDSQCYQNNNIRQNTETMSIDVKNSFQQPLPLFHYDRYYFNKEEEEDEERKRKNERRFRRMLYSNFYAMHYIINNSNYNNQLRSFPLYVTNNRSQLTNQYFTIDANPQMSKPDRKIPYAIKFYKCKECLNEMLFPIYNFKQIASIKEMNYESICQIFHKKYLLAKLGKLLKDCLFYKINTDPCHEKTSLKTITIPNLFIETPIPLIIKETLSMIYNFDDPARWLFELLNVEEFIDIGEIDSDHWIMRAYNSKQGNIIALDKNELKEFFTITNASFVLIKFKRDQILRYMFSWIPLSNNPKI